MYILLSFRTILIFRMDRDYSLSTLAQLSMTPTRELFVFPEGPCLQHKLIGPGWVVSEHRKDGDISLRDECYSSLESHAGAVADWPKGKGGQIPH